MFGAKGSRPSLAPRGAGFARLSSQFTYGSPGAEVPGQVLSAPRARTGSFHPCRVTVGISAHPSLDQNAPAYSGCFVERQALTRQPTLHEFEEVP